MCAAFNGHAESARLLIAAGADSRIRTQYGQDALDIARQCARAAVVAVLEGMLSFFLLSFFISSRPCSSLLDTRTL
eukprot:m.45521 g.45521  ORF g.45521 m.45521 type:complete len:76 (-) comp47261_c0_seq1:489-716(-)